MILRSQPLNLSLERLPRRRVRPFEVEQPLLDQTQFVYLVRHCNTKTINSLSPSDGIEKKKRTLILILLLLISNEPYIASEQIKLGPNRIQRPVDELPVRYWAATASYDAAAADGWPGWGAGGLEGSVLWMMMMTMTGEESASSLRMNE
jgi:hypothetical protein